PTSIASDAVAAGLKAHGIKKKIAIMEPYYPCIEPRLNAVLGAHGYEIVRFCHMRGKSPASCSVLTAQDMIKAIRSIDGPDVEAIVAFGANPGLPARPAPGAWGRACFPPRPCLSPGWPTKPSAGSTSRCCRSTRRPT